jgi:hypothetical protein
MVSVNAEKDDVNDGKEEEDKREETVREFV